MSQVRLLLDANLSWRSVAELKPYFDDCQHVDKTDMKSPAKDSEIWEYARTNSYMIVTNDEDFLHLSTLKGFPPKVILLRTGNQSRRFIEQILINLKGQILEFATSDDYGLLEFI